MSAGSKGFNAAEVRAFLARDLGRAPGVYRLGGEGGKSAGGAGGGGGGVWGGKREG